MPNLSMGVGAVRFSASNFFPWNQAGVFNVLTRHDINEVRDPFRLVRTTLNGRYLIASVAGKGSMSVVYRAQDSRYGRPVAVKVLHPVLANSSEKSKTNLKLFKRGVKAARKLKHPNIVSTYGSGADGRLAFVVMEWLDGHTLDNELNTGPLPLERVGTILNQMCEALDRAHNKRIIHLDLKPANVFVLDSGTTSQVSDRTVVKLIDFGFARIVNSTAGDPLSRYIGTPSYSAPEVYKKKASRLSDVYSLGVTAFEMLTGELPFTESQIRARTYKGQELRCPSARNLNREIPEAIDELLRRTVNQHQGIRPKNAKDFYNEFQVAFPFTRKPQNEDLSSSYVKWAFRKIRG